VLAYTVNILSRLVEVCPKVYFLIFHATVNSLKIYVFCVLMVEIRYQLLWRFLCNFMDCDALCVVQSVLACWVQNGLQVWFFSHPFNTCERYHFALY
jgi:hypothetical protein